MILPVKQQQQQPQTCSTQAPQSQSNTPQPQSLSLASKNIDARRWSFASMHSSSSGYSGGTNTPPLPPPPVNPVKLEEPFRSSSLSSSSTQSACLGYDDSNISDQFSHYSSDEKLIQKLNIDDSKPFLSQKSGGFDSQETTIVQVASATPVASRQSLCGNLNCPNCCLGGSLAASINLECMSKSNEPPFVIADGRSRICSSSNDSSQLDESYEGGRSSPIAFQRQRARSLR